MDRPQNLMVVVAVVFLGRAPDMEEVSALVRSRVVDRYPVFRQKVERATRPGARPHWVDDEDFDLDRHLHHVTLTGGGDAALQRYMERHVAIPLDAAHPLWELHLVDGYDAGAAIVCRTHHALADGLALAQVLLSLTDEDADDDAAGPPAAAPPPVREPVTSRPGPVTARSGPAAQALRRGHGALARALGTASRARRWGTPRGARDATRLALRTGQVAADLLLGHNPSTPLSGAPGTAKRIAWTGPLPLDGPKRIGRLAGATLNDVLLSAMAAALRSYQESRGAEPVDLITMVPVNLRDLRADLPAELGNDFTLVYFRFPCATTAPLARLAETKRRMDWLKASPEVALTHLLMEVIGRVGRGLDRPVIDFFANKALGVTTNVIGPTGRRRLAGVPVDGILGWVPGSGSHTLGVCIFTYAGTVRVGVLTDAAVVPDPERLVAAFEAELDLLVSLATPARAVS
jgi:WS/DGAT/MGAT family acyltransferase